MKFSFSNRVQLAHRHDKDKLNIYSVQTTIVCKARLTLYESVSLGQQKSVRCPYYAG